MEINLNQLLSDSRSVLCLNGDLPKFRHIPRNLACVAVDGAAHRLMKRGITPHLITGDLDSVLPEALLSGVPICPTPQQNQCDFEKAMPILKARHFTPTIVCGLAGKEMDHYWNNMNLLARLSFEYPMVFYHQTAVDTHQVGVAVYDRFAVHLPAHSTLSIIPFPKATVSTTGLSWELHKATLEFTGRASIRNRTQSQDVQIKVHAGVIVVIVDGASLISALLA